MEKQINKQKKEEQEIPIIQQISCYMCGTYNHSLIGMSFDNSLLFKCDNCGIINSLQLDPTKNHKPKPIQKKQPASYLG